MLKILLVAFSIAFSVGQAYGHEVKDEPNQLIRVGVFNNPPIAFKGDNNEWHGIAIDVLQAVAGKQNWQLEFVPGSFSGHLKNFEDHQIDLIIMMAYSPKRAEKYTFTRNAFISNWGLIYSQIDSNIGSLLDLNGKKVAVMRNNIHDKAFRKLAKEFGLKIEIAELDNFSDVMESVSTGKADAGVANRLFGALNADKYSLVETGIIFNPINIHYSVMDPEHTAIINTIDQYMSEFKTNKNSVYFKSIRHWMGQAKTNEFPRWIIWLTLGLFSAVVLMIGLTVLMRRQVEVRTKELQLEVDERRETQQRLDTLAYYDSLTKLPNRVSFTENLKLSIASAHREKKRIAILFIDIDRFKTVNDSLGHEAGDQLIIHVAKSMKDCLRGEDSLNRFGGDEFVAILHNIQELSDINLVTERMLECLNAPIIIEKTEIYSSVCIGVSLYPDDDNEGGNLLKYADAAMYHAKEQGGNNCQFYNEKLTQRVQRRLSLETRMRHALERDELRLHYQPIFSLIDEQPVGVEALIRWQDPDRGLILPDDFIPIAEDTGIIFPIGEWVMEHACSQVHEWESQGLGNLQLSINISSEQFKHNKLYSNVISALKNTGLRAGQLELEITERIFLNITNNVRETLNNLKSEGLKLSIDDFGTGYSSLSYLKQLPIDTLKIDRSFIMGIPEDKDDAQIASTIISMAHGLGLDVVAEGIESEDQLNFLNALGCSRGQGSYLCKPLPANEFSDWFKKKISADK
jgi:diguanylate cyclase (GGDEF)-like protein